jgi:diacylglycerol kinase (ATP)
MKRNPPTHRREPARRQAELRPDDLAERLKELEEPPVWTARAGRRGFREKLAASLRGLKYALRGDSSYFAHIYRFLFIAMTAALLGVGPLEWCFLGLSFALVFMAELANSAIDTLARALGDPEEPAVCMAREIATAGVLIAVTTSAALSITVLTLKVGVLFGWWGQPKT